MGIRLLVTVAFGLAIVLSHGISIAAQTSQAVAEKNPKSITLGGNELTSGIPSSYGSPGFIADEQAKELRSAKGSPSQKAISIKTLQAWLADDRNHEPLKPRLPIGLRSAQSELSNLEANTLTRAKIELGRQLFFDKRLSRDKTISCASCHAPENSFASNDRLAIGIREQIGKRNAPAAINRLLSTAQYHDGRAATLEEQVLGPIANEAEMGFTHEEVVKRLSEVEGYRLQFESIFDEEIDINNVAKAIAAFERVLVTGPTPWDHYARLSAFASTYSNELTDRKTLKEEDPELAEAYDQLLLTMAENPLSSAAKRGGKLFFSQRVNCASCHAGANFTDESFHNIGIGLENPKNPLTDWGRSAITQKESERGAFKTPTLRNVALTAPYMHDGSLETLADVIAWYVKGGDPNPNQSELIEPLSITESEQADLVAFLESLTGSLPAVSSDGIPE